MNQHVTQPDWQDQYRQRLAVAAFRESRAMRRHGDITVQQSPRERAMKALTYLPQTEAAICAASDCSSSTVRAVLSDLIKRDMVERFTNETPDRKRGQPMHYYLLRPGVVL